MTNTAAHVHRDAIFCFAFLLWAVADAGRASSSALTNQPAAPGVDSRAAVLTAAEQVHRLTREEAAGGRPVLIRGVITCALPPFNAAVVQDATRGIYIDRVNLSLGQPPQVGELVEIEGVTDAGHFAPLIHAVRIARLGTRELPPPIQPYWDQLINGSLDTQLVEIEGIITAVRADGVTLLTHGGTINALIFGANATTNDLALKPYEGALVRLRGCLFASWNQATHEVNLSEVRMFGPSVTVVKPAPGDAFAVTPKRVSDLLQFDLQASALRRVKVAGQVVHGRAGEYYAMDGTNGFRFIPSATARLGVGDTVEVVGFPNLTGPSPVLREAVVRRTGSGPLPAPVRLAAEGLFRAEHDATWVRVEAVLLGLSRDQETLEMQAGLRRFLARLKASQGLLEAVPLGSRVELTGVYSGHGGGRTVGNEVDSFELLLNSPLDLRVLARPPWWTLERLLILVGALLGVLGLALVWIWALQHKVEQRTAQLRREVQDREGAEQQRALAQERARIARDLHDDLGSSLTEISMLATRGPGSKLPPDQATERMKTIAGKSRTLVDALDEIVWAVDPERDTLGSVARYLASYAEGYLGGLSVRCRVQVPNSLPDQVISGEVRHHLFLAVKEALNNAVCHGDASEVGFRVRVLEDRLCILITDNGSGFDTFGRSNGHGLANLRNRLEHLHGRCELTSSPGTGTTVCLELPLPGSLNPP